MGHNHYTAGERSFYLELVTRGYNDEMLLRALKKTRPNATMNAAQSLRRRLLGASKPVKSGTRRKSPSTGGKPYPDELKSLILDMRQRGVPLPEIHRSVKGHRPGMTLEHLVKFVQYWDSRSWRPTTSVNECLKLAAKAKKDKVGKNPGYQGLLKDKGERLPWMLTSKSPKAPVQSEEGISLECKDGSRATVRVHVPELQLNFVGPVQLAVKLYTETCDYLGLNDDSAG